VLLLFGLAGGPGIAPPAGLTDENPEALLRWNSLRPVGGERITGDTAIELAVRGPVVRLEAAFTTRCEPWAARRAGDAGRSIDVPLVFSADGPHRRLLAIPPAVGWTPAALDPESEKAPTLLRVGLPPGCPALSVRAFEAALEPDEYALIRLALLLRRSLGAVQAPEQVARWLAGPFPHRWQEEAAFAVVAPGLLEELPGVDAGARALAAAWLEEALGEGRGADLTQARLHPLPARGLPALDGGLPGVALGRGISLEVDVAGEEAVRLLQRASLSAGYPAGWRLSVTFDDGPSTVLPAFAGLDPAVPAWSRVRTAVVAVPAGARRARITSLDRAVALWGFTLRHKVHLEDLLSVHGASVWLEKARAAASSDPRTVYARALARAALGDAGGVAQAMAEAAGHPLLQALAALVGGARIADPEAATLLLDSAAAALAQAGQHPVVPVLTARLGRLRARLALARGDARMAAATWRWATAARPPCDEDALALADADALAVEDPDRRGRALALIEGLLARRPLDGTLTVARGRLQALASRWRSLLPADDNPPFAFLEPASVRLGAELRERSFFAPFAGGRVLRVRVDPPAIAAAAVPLALVAARRGGPPGLVRVVVDGRVAAVFPVVAALERMELPLAPGSHDVSVDQGDFTGAVLFDAAALDQPGPDKGAPLRLRRYAEVTAAGLSIPLPESGTSGALLLALRAFTSGTGPMPEVEVELRGVAASPVRLRVRPGPASAGLLADLPPGALASESLEVAVPITGASPELVVAASPPTGVRLLAHAAVRVRRPIGERADAVASVPALEPAAAWTEVERLTARLTAPGANPSTYLARAELLASLEEVGLAREDLLSALEHPQLRPEQRLRIVELARVLDDDGARWAGLSAAGLWDGARGDRLGPALAALLADREALAALSPWALRQRAGAVGDLAVLEAARQAEVRKEAGRASSLLRALTSRSPDPSFQRELGAALLRVARSGPEVTRAYLQLFTAARLAPEDARARRLLRRAAARTRVNVLAFAEESAGTESLPVPPGRREPSAETALLPPAHKVADVLVSGARETVTSFRLARPVRLELDASITDLRAHEARAQGAAPVALAWARDGEPFTAVRCQPAGPSGARCRQPAIELGAGRHTLALHLEGGVRPAGWAWFEEPPGAGPRPAPGVQPSAGATGAGDYFLARPDLPVRLRIQGPTLLEIEARARIRARPAKAVVVTASTGPAAPLSLTVSPPAARDPLGGATDVGAPVNDGLALTEDAVYLVEVRPRSGEALVRLQARQGDELAGAPAAAATPPSPAPVEGDRTLAPPAVDETLVLHDDDGPVPPGGGTLGSFGVSAGWARRLRNAEGAEIQTSAAFITALSWRRRFEPARLTLRTSAELRARGLGSPAQWAGAEAFFIDPAHRWLRLQATLEAATQPIDGARAWSGKATFLIEPVATLMPGLHLVTKLGGWASRRSLGRVDGARLPWIDPDVYSRFSDAHPRGLFFEGGLETEPLANLVLYANARLTTNANLAPWNQDHLSTAALARALFGRVYAEASLRSTWFFVDADRPDPKRNETLFLSLFHTLWPSERQYLEVGSWAAYHLDGRQTELIVYLAWEGSNGRRFRDHTPLQGEDYFFAQRGPSSGGAHLVAAPTPAEARP
jgi:hypothetical protein